jgi:hypothetical protein
MITTANLEVLAEKLRVYDVDQQAWEQEPNGFEANAGHVLTHLVNNLVGKNFENEDLVRSAIAPDSLQYGLRLARWSGIHVADLVSVTMTEEHMRSQVEESLGYRKLPWGFASFAGGMHALSMHLHNMGHAREKDGAVHTRQAAMRSASRLLINSASVQAHQLDFSLIKAFDDRLSSLRARFGIPQPQDI